MRASLGIVGLALAACGGAAPQPASTAAPASPLQDSRTPIERRRDTACAQLGPKITACAVEDTRTDFAANKIDKAQLDRDTAPEIQAKNTDKFIAECKAHGYSSRQVRVLEVCFHQEPQCGPLIDCLGHLSDQPR